MVVRNRRPREIATGYSQKIEAKCCRKLRLEKVVTNKHLRLAVETDEERRARLENDAATKWLRLAMETDKKEKLDWRRW